MRTVCCVKILLFFCLVLSVQGSLNAQDGRLYIDNAYKTVVPDSAVYYRYITKADSVWVVKDFYLFNDSLAHRFSFRDKALTIQHGIQCSYFPNGILNEQWEMEDDRLIHLLVFHADGTRKANVLFAEGKVVTQQLFDTEGKLIKGGVYAKEAQFPGGASEWQSYLEFAFTEYPPGKKWKGEAVVRFTLDTKGFVSNAIIESSSGNKEKDAHAQGIIERSPQWIPAIFDSRPSEFVLRQKFTYGN